MNTLLQFSGVHLEYQNGQNLTEVIKGISFTINQNERLAIVGKSGSGKTSLLMLMAGLDGIKNKIHPGESFDKDLYELPPEEVKAIPTVCGSLREAMESLDKDREFLTEGGVFTDDQIDAYIALKFEEIHKFEHAPHPVEFEMYYSS